MSWEINSIIVEEDGDWLMCPACQGQGQGCCVIKTWSYCPTCGIELNIKEIDAILGLDEKEKEVVKE